MKVVVAGVGERGRFGESCGDLPADLDLGDFPEFAGGSPDVQVVAGEASQDFADPRWVGFASKGHHLQLCPARIGERVAERGGASCGGGDVFGGEQVAVKVVHECDVALAGCQQGVGEHAVEVVRAEVGTALEQGPSVGPTQGGADAVDHDGGEEAKAGAHRSGARSARDEGVVDLPGRGVG